MVTQSAWYSDVPELVIPLFFLNHPVPKYSLNNKFYDQIFNSSHLKILHLETLFYKYLTGNSVVFKNIQDVCEINYE